MKFGISFIESKLHIYEICWKKIAFAIGSTDKGAVDLYAILQQTRSEETANTILSSEHSTRFEDSETQFPTTLRLAPTTTTTTTTQAPTTTTTTTTTTPAPAPARQAPGSGPVRSRYRGSLGNRNGLTSTTTTTTTELPQSEEVTEKRKFKPTRERNTQVMRWFISSLRQTYLVIP